MRVVGGIALKLDIMLISARPYNFTDQKTGEVKKGWTVHYSLLGDPPEGQIGNEPIKASVKTVPKGLEAGQAYQAEFITKLESGKPVMKLSEILA